MSHGNVRVESGFSLNDQVLNVNLKEPSVLVQRIVYEGIQNERVMNLDINKLMLKYVENYSKAYKKALDENRKKQTIGENRKNEKRCLNNKLKAAKKAKKDAYCIQQTTINEFDSKIHCLEEALRRF